MRLNEKNLSSLPANVQRPSYDRSKVVGSIVHLGIGAFHRAHQAMFTDIVLASGDLAWGIVGAGIISAEMKNALEPQDHLYALAERSADAEKLKVIGSIVGVFGGAEDAGALLARMSDAVTRIVSITVTEKGYYLDPATGKLQLQAQAIADDLATPEQLFTECKNSALVKRNQAQKAADTASKKMVESDDYARNAELILDGTYAEGEVQ